MDPYGDKYSINPETGEHIKIGGKTWRRLAAKYYCMEDGMFTDQPIPDSRVYVLNKIFGRKQASPRSEVLRKSKRVANPAIEGKYVYFGSKAWNELYNQYEWDGHKFGEKRQRHLPDYLITAEKRREIRRNKAFDRKVAEGRVSDVIDSSLGYALTYYHTVDRDMYKEWVKEKRTKKDFCLNNDFDNRLWVRLPGEKRDEEVEPINLIIDETGELNEIVKKYIIKGMREHNQYFITIMAYNLMWAHDGEPKILNLTDDRLGHLRIVRRERIDEWIEDYLRWYGNAVEEQETEGSGFVYHGWIGFHVEMFPLRTFIGHGLNTPAIIGKTAINPSIYDNRCLQRCLILASEGGHEIIANRMIDDRFVYNRWWKQPDKYKVFGVTIHEVEDAMGICKNRAFVQSEEKFAALEELLKVSLNVFEVTLLPGYDDNSEDKYDLFTCYQVSRSHSCLDTMTTPRINTIYSRVIKCTSRKGRVDVCHFVS